MLSIPNYSKKMRRNSVDELAGWTIQLCHANATCGRGTETDDETGATMRKTHLTNGCKTAARNSRGVVAVPFWSFITLADECRCERCDASGQMRIEARKIQEASELWEPETGAAADAWKTERTR